MKRSKIIGCLCKYSTKACCEGLEKEVRHQATQPITFNTTVERITPDKLKTVFAELTKARRMTILERTKARNNFERNFGLSTQFMDEASNDSMQDLPSAIKLARIAPALAGANSILIALQILVTRKDDKIRGTRLSHACLLVPGVVANYAVESSQSMNSRVSSTSHDFISDLTEYNCRELNHLSAHRSILDLFWLIIILYFILLMLLNLGLRLESFK